MKMIKYAIIGLLALMPAMLFAQTDIDLTFSWDASPDHETLASYNLYEGVQQDDGTLDFSKIAIWGIDGLVAVPDSNRWSKTVSTTMTSGETRSYLMTAENEQGLESLPSNTVRFTYDQPAAPGGLGVTIEQSSSISITPR